MEYRKIDEKEIEDSLEKRTFAKNEIERNLLNKQVETTIGDTVYIQNVIKVFVDGDKTLAESIYKEPLKTGGHVDPITPEQKKKILDGQKKELQRSMEKKIDNTATKKIRGF